MRNYLQFPCYLISSIVYKEIAEQQFRTLCCRDLLNAFGPYHSSSAKFANHRYGIQSRATSVASSVLVLTDVSSDEVRLQNAASLSPKIANEQQTLAQPLLRSRIIQYQQLLLTRFNMINVHRSQLGKAERKLALVTNVFPLAWKLAHFSVKSLLWKKSFQPDNALVSSVFDRAWIFHATITDNPKL